MIWLNRRVVLHWKHTVPWCQQCFEERVSSLVCCLLHFWWMSSCTYDMPRSACNVALETYPGASTIILRILDWLLWIFYILDSLAQPHNSRPYVQDWLFTRNECGNEIHFADQWSNNTTAGICPLTSNFPKIVLQRRVRELVWLVLFSITVSITLRANKLYYYLFRFAVGTY
jgi:hypothetical protein